jgi:hypothetical protein
MIITKQVNVKSSLYYKNKGYNIDEKYITVNISDVPTGSRVLVSAVCDFCNLKKELSYKDYNRNISKGNKYACSVKCGSIKAKQTNLENLGAESHFQLDNFKEKVKNKLVEKWGVDHISKSKEISKKKSKKMKLKSSEVSNRMKKYYDNLSKDDLNKINQKRENTNLEKWGYKYVSQVESIKDKIKATNLEKWGGYTLESEELRKKVFDTNLSKYGYKYPMKGQISKEKYKVTNLERWGVDNPMKLDLFKNKLKDTLLSKYNEINIMFSEDFRKKFNITKEKGYVKYLGNRLYQFFCNHCGLDYDIDYDNYYKRKLRNCSTCTKCFPILANSSIKELELYNFIKSIYNSNIIQSYRDGLEIDIYIPNLNIGFEFNGLYWHSDERLDRNYHLNKTNYFKERGIRIIHIWEDDWDFRKEIVKSQIKNLLNKTNIKIWARSCYVREIKDSKLTKKFLEENHIQGNIRSNLKIGLYNGDELVSIMTFDNFEGRKKMEPGGWNLSRFCSKKNTNIVGASSKLLKYFVKNYKPKRLISFADKDWSLGSLYYTLGFKLVKDIRPDYKFIINGKRINKQRLTKSKLIKLGNDPKLTESQITDRMGISKIYNVGQLKFEMTFSRF